MKIYAYTNSGPVLDKYLGKDIWVKCDVQRIMFFPGTSSSSWAQDHPCWVRVTGKVESSGNMIGITSTWYADELRQRAADNGDIYFVNYVECDWDKTSERPISKFALNNSESYKDGLVLVYAKDITVMTPIDMMSTEELFDPSWLDIPEQNHSDIWEDEWGR